MKKIFLIIISLFLLSGCYNYQELNDLAIISGISISLINQEYEMTIEVINPKNWQNKTNTEKTNYIIYKEKGSSLQEAFHKIIQKIPLKLYLSHLNILIIDESIAKQHLDKVLDFFAREPNIRNDFYVLIGQNKDFLHTTPLETISSQKILEILKQCNTELGYTNLVSFHDLLQTYLNPYIEPAISKLNITDNEEKKDKLNNIKTQEKNATNYISGIGIFKNNKLTGYLENKDALVFNIVTNKAKTYYIKTNDNKNNYAIYKITHDKTSLTLDVKRKKIDISVFAKASIVEYTINDNLENIKTIHNLQNDLNNEVKKMTQNSISKTLSNYHTDIYGFENALYHKKPKFIKELKQSKFNNVLNNINITVSPHIQIIKKGNLNGGLYNE